MVENFWINKGEKESLGRVQVEERFGGDGEGHERERMEDRVENNKVLMKYDKSVFFIWSNG